jgi:hypothetical protein
MWPPPARTSPAGAAAAAGSPVPPATTCWCCWPCTYPLQCPSLQLPVPASSSSWMCIEELLGEECVRQREGVEPSSASALQLWRVLLFRLDLLSCIHAHSTGKQHGTGAPRDSGTGGAAARVLPGCATPPPSRVRVVGLAPRPASPNPVTSVASQSRPPSLVP